MALYLIHVSGERGELNLKTDQYKGGNNINIFSKWKEIRTSPWTDGFYEFPGAYFSLVTEDNLKKLNIYFGKFALFFSVRLLEQTNWHLNLGDQNGMISEFNTYYPWNLDEALEKIKQLNKTGIDLNEVVFHDPVPMKYLVQIIEKPANFEPGNKDKFLPQHRLVNDEPPDMSKKPFYVYPFEDSWTGVSSKPIPKSSSAFFHMMARVAGVNLDDRPWYKKTLNTFKSNNNVLVEEIKKSAKFLWTHRDEQHIEFLEDYTAGHKSINKMIIHSSI